MSAMSEEHAKKQAELELMRKGFDRCIEIFRLSIEMGEATAKSGNSKQFWLHVTDIVDSVEKTRDGLLDGQPFMKKRPGYEKITDKKTV